MVGSRLLWSCGPESRRGGDERGHHQGHRLDQLRRHFRPYPGTGGFSRCCLRGKRSDAAFPAGGSCARGSRRRPLVVAFAELGRRRPDAARAGNGRGDAGGGRGAVSDREQLLAGLAHASGKSCLNSRFRWFDAAMFGVWRTGLVPAGEEGLVLLPGPDGFQGRLAVDERLAFWRSRGQERQRLQRAVTEAELQMRISPPKASTRRWRNDLASLSPSWPGIARGSSLMRRP